MMSNIIGLVFVVIAGLFCFIGFIFFVLVVSLESMFNSVKKIFIKDKLVRRKRGWKKI